MGMSIIIGGSTTVSFGSACVVQAQWGFNPNQQDAFCLGQWSPDLTKTIFKPENTVSLSLYSPGPTYDTNASTSCVTATGLSITISPGACGGSVAGGVSGSFYPTSYSYSKESKDVMAQESWSLVQYKGVGIGGITGLTMPKYILKGIAKGQTSDSAKTGITLAAVIATIESGSVSAGAMGKAESLSYGVVTKIGAGNGTASSGPATGSAQMPYIPLYID